MHLALAMHQAVVLCCCQFLCGSLPSAPTKHFDMAEFCKKSCLVPSAPIKHWSFWNAEAWGKSAFLRMLYRCWWLDFLQNSAIATYLEYAKSLGSQRYWNEPSKPAWYIQSWIFPPNPAISKHLECTEGTPHRAEERLGKAQDNCLAQPWFICNISLVYVLLSV